MQRNGIKLHDTFMLSCLYACVLCRTGGSTIPSNGRKTNVYDTSIHPPTHRSALPSNLSNLLCAHSIDRPTPGFGCKLLIETAKIHRGVGFHAFRIFNIYQSQVPNPSRSWMDDCRWTRARSSSGGSFVIQFALGRVASCRRSNSRT